MLKDDIWSNDYKVSHEIREEFARYYEYDNQVYKLDTARTHKCIGMWDIISLDKRSALLIHLFNKSINDQYKNPEVIQPFYLREFTQNRIIKIFSYLDDKNPDLIINPINQQPEDSTILVRKKILNNFLGFNRS